MRAIIPYVLLFYFIFFISTLSSTHAQIRINEIGIEQNPQTIELINISSGSADISHWYLDDAGGTTYLTIPDNTHIYPLSCIVFTYDLNLNKSSPDIARLFDATAPPTSNSARLIDSYSYKSSPGNGLTYSRLPDGADSWATAEASFGLWNNTHENCIISPTSTPTAIPTPTTTPPISITNIPTSTPTSYQNTYNSIYFSEVMVYPEKNETEWIELYNDNDFSVSLHNWYIDDLENEGSSPKLFSLEIPPKQYGVFELSSSLFNNGGDSVRLLDTNKNEKDTFEYSSAVQGKTFGRISFESDLFCLQNPSKNVPNNPCIEPTPQPTSKTNSTPTNNSIMQSKKTNAITQESIQPTHYSSLPVSNIQPLQNNVLGENTQRELSPVSPVYFYQTPFYISFSYSLLTIFSTLIKMKNAF